jgi:hypothetical protein
MSRVYLGLLAAGALSLLGAQPAAAGCCNSWGAGWGPSWGVSAGWNSWSAGRSWGAGASWGWGRRGCCWSGGAVALQPVVVQPAPVLVQVAQPVVLVRQPVAALAVEQGPVYSGPGTDYWPRYYQSPRSVAAYPFVGGGYVDAPAYRRPHRHHHAGVHTSHRWSGHHRSGPRHHHRHRGDVPKYYGYK